MIVQTDGTSESGEYPVRFWFDEAQALEVLEIEDRWYSTKFTYFKVFADNARRYILMRDNNYDIWDGIEVQI